MGKIFSFPSADSDLRVPYDRYPVEVSDAVIGRKKKRDGKTLGTKDARRFERGWIETDRGGGGEKGRQGETIVERRIK